MGSQIKPKSNSQEESMGKLDAAIKSEMIRLAKREMRKVFVPLRRDVRMLKNKLS